MRPPATIEVVRGGALTTVQDLGRSGFESSGVPRGGAFDPWAARAANRLVGNQDQVALLELTLAGPRLRFHNASAVALVGDDFPILVDAKLRLRNEELELHAGAILDLGRARSGARAWLAIRGGLDLPLVLGSRSTELATGFGGHQGRALRTGDSFSSFPSMEALASRSSDSRFRYFIEPDASAPSALRILPGPDERLLGSEGASSLTMRRWRVSPRSDRRGVRLEGEPLALGAGSSAPTAASSGFMRSIPMLPGAVELTPAGEPIVLGVDAPVTGGYPWIAQLIEADVGRLAHLAPGSEVRFESVSFEQAAVALEALSRVLPSGECLDRASP